MHLRNTTPKLFRQEAIIFRRDAWLGSPRLIQPISVQLATGVGAAVVALVLAFLIFGNYTRRVRVHGAVVPSTCVLHVFTPQTGRLLQAYAVDGAVVTAGDPLFLLGTDTTTNLGEAESVVKEQLQSRIDELSEAIRQRFRLDQVKARSEVASRYVLHRGRSGAQYSLRPMRLLNARQLHNGAFRQRNRRVISAYSISKVRSAANNIVMTGMIGL